MNQAKLLDRISLLTGQLEQIKSQYTALQSHLNEAQYWLDLAVKEEHDKLQIVIQENVDGEVNVECAEQTPCE